jgi:hypothetical protein
MRVAAGVALVLALMLGWALRPVCVAIPADTLAGFDGPIEERRDRDFYLQVFQKRADGWYQCKTWISRTLFF